MKNATRTARWVGAALAFVAIAPACLGKTQVRYYTLAGGGVVAPARRGDVQYTVHVAPAVVPEALDRSEVVLRVSDTQVAVDDNHRWAEPLRTGIARAVAVRLARELDGAQVSASERAPQPTSDVELTIDVQRLEVSLTDGVILDVVWTARWANDGPIRAGRSAARARGAPPGDYDAAVAACGAALEVVGSEIARSVRVEHLSRR
jgi:uncharacterized lipoprotein YmbA